MGAILRFRGGNTHFRGGYTHFRGGFTTVCEGYTMLRVNLVLGVSLGQAKQQVLMIMLTDYAVVCL